MNNGSLSLSSRRMSQGLAGAADGDSLLPRHLLGTTHLPGTCKLDPCTCQPPSLTLTLTGEVLGTQSTAWKSGQAWLVLEAAVSVARHMQRKINTTVAPSGCTCVKHGQHSGGGGCLWGHTYRGLSLRHACAQLSML